MLPSLKDSFFRGLKELHHMVQRQPPEVQCQQKQWVCVELLNHFKFSKKQWAQFQGEHLRLVLLIQNLTEWGGHNFFFFSIWVTTLNTGLQYVSERHHFFISPCNLREILVWSPSVVVQNVFYEFWVSHSWGKLNVKAKFEWDLLRISLKYQFNNRGLKKHASHLDCQLSTGIKLNKGFF